MVIVVPMDLALTSRYRLENVGNEMDMVLTRPGRRPPPSDL
jgi:hypothetical protein